MIYLNKLSKQRVTNKAVSWIRQTLYRLDRKVSNVTGVRGDFANNGITYLEREEYGPSNLEEKLERAKSGGPFEYPDIMNLNRAVLSMVGDESRIVELGAGTGKFALAVANELRRSVVASEYDKKTYHWCLHNIGESELLKFVNGPVTSAYGQFDLAVSIEVVEHVKNFHEFLKGISELAPRALITTPNRMRSIRDYHSGPPRFIKHVREWTAGEFYWVLRCFWADVKMYGVISNSKPAVTEVSVDTRLSPLIADCRDPL